MKTVNFEEYQKAKNEIIEGVVYKENTREENGRIIKSYISEKDQIFHEIMSNGIVEFWSDKHSESRYYDDRTVEEKIKAYEEKIAGLVVENRELTEALESEKEKLEEAQDDLKEVQRDLEKAQDDLADAEEELEEAKDTISDLKDKFADIESIVAGV